MLIGDKFYNVAIWFHALGNYFPGWYYAEYATLAVMITNISWVVHFWYFKVRLLSFSAFLVFRRIVVHWTIFKFCTSCNSSCYGIGAPTMFTS